MLSDNNESRTTKHLAQMRQQSDFSTAMWSSKKKKKKVEPGSIFDWKENEIHFVVCLFFGCNSASGCCWAKTTTSTIACVILHHVIFCPVMPDPTLSCPATWSCTVIKSYSVHQLQSDLPLSHNIVKDSTRLSNRYSPQTSSELFHPRKQP